MKKVLLTIALATITVGAFAQGRVNFANNTTPAGSLIITNGQGVAGVGTGPISGPSASFRFELFAAANGVTDPTLFVSTGYTNANSSLLGAGRISSRSSIDLGQAVATVVQVQVRGWSANLGLTWAQAYANSQDADFLTGLGTQLAWISDYTNTVRTPIGRVALAGTVPNGPTIFLSGTAPPAGTVQISGMELTLVPEPSTIALGLMGIGATLVLIRRRK